MNSIDDYQDFTHTTAMYRKPLEHVDEQIMYCMLGLTGETGEVAEKLKKKLRGGGSLSEFHHDPVIAKELGDIAWYWVQLCSLFGYPASAVLKMNVEKLRSRQARGVVHGEGDER